MRFRGRVLLLFAAVIGLTLLMAGCSGGGPGTVYYGSIAGTVRDAMTAAPLEGVTVNIEGISTRTDQYGHYRVDNLEKGTNNMTVVKSGYYGISRTVYVSRNQVSVENYSLSPLLAPGQMRIVLTWGGVPADLDSHLRVPTSDSNPSIGYDVGGGNLGFMNSYPYATLSWDEQDGYGPEAITIYDRLTEEYHYFVFNYSAEEDLPYSEARVEVYNSGGLMRRYTVPSYGSGDYWNVFKISPYGQLIDINQIQDYASTAAGSSRVEVQKIKAPTESRR